MKDKKNSQTGMSMLLNILLFILFFYSTVFCQEDSLTIKYNYINSIPQNAEVYIDDTLAGYTPYRFSAEKHPVSILLKMKGYPDVSITADYPLNKTVMLIPLNKKNVSPLVEENKQTAFKTKRKVIPIAMFSILTAGSAISAYYFKKLANDKYDEYSLTGDKTLLDKTKRYDLISGISIGLFQAGLAGLLYYLFIE